MPAGTKRVLFLYWDSSLEVFDVMHVENGAFEFQGDTIVTAGRQPFALEGRSRLAFLAALAHNP